MNHKLTVIIKNTSYSFLANIISLCISSLVILIVPKKIGILEYGYFQLYLFYTSYIGFFHLGWCDGIYLRNGGKRYSDVDKQTLRLQFWLLLVLTITASVIGFAVLPFTYIDYEKINIIKMTLICASIVLPRALIWLLLQAVGEIVDYSKYTIIEKIVYLGMVITFLLFPSLNYKFLIISDLSGKIVSLLCSCYKYHDLIFGKICTIANGFEEIKKNLSAGFKLMLANVASLLIIGIVRMGIEKNWGISEFGKVSLSISLCNLLLVFINAMGMVLFPMLKRSSDRELTKIYEAMELSVSFLLYLVLLLYYPLRYFLILWLPQYTESIYYMMFLFPMCLYESKMALIFNTYLKIFRKEQTIMNINLLNVVMSCLVTLINTIYIKSLIFSVLSIVMLLGLRYLMGHVATAKLLKIDSRKAIYEDVKFGICFILIAFICKNPWIATCVYLMLFLSYSYRNRLNILMLLRKVLSFH